MADDLAVTVATRRRRRLLRLLAMFRSPSPPPARRRVACIAYYGKGLGIVLLTVLLFSSLFHTNSHYHNGLTFAEFHLGLTQSCTEFWDHLASNNDTFWDNFPPAVYPVNRHPAKPTSQNLPLCPDFPNNLEGALNVTFEAYPWAVLDEMHKNLEMGGRWSPKHCRPRHRVAIIIPYRDRDQHLRILLSHLHPFLQKQLVEYRIYVSEQDFKSSFNRGMMKNIGALHAMEMQDIDCVFFHDVDLVPEHDHNLYYCQPTPRHFSVAIDSRNYEAPYKDHFGGVVTLTKDQFVAVNGYSNAYFRWGSEDDDISKRIRHNHMCVEQNLQAVGRYKMIPHQKDPPNEDRWRRVRWAHCRYEFDGMNSLKYKLLKIENKRLYTRIYASINETDVMHAIPLPSEKPLPQIVLMRYANMSLWTKVKNFVRSLFIWS